MPSSAVRTFADPDEYAAWARATTVQLTIVERGRFEAKIICVDLHHLRMQRFVDNLPRIVHSANDPGYATISLRTQPGPSLRRSGVEMLESNIIRRGHAETFFQQSAGPVCFGSMSLPLDVMAAVGLATVGCDLTPPKDALTVVPPPAALYRLQRLHDAAALLAEDAPVVLAQPEAARGLEQALIGAMVDCLGPEDVNEDRSGLRQHKAIMQRFHGSIERHLDQPLYIPELCVEIGTSERTLRVCCQEMLGMSPKRYLLLRRMHLVQRALRASSRINTTVTDIATRYGFWQFGRFAGEYKALFGESPSVMLARPTE
jgi:AraC-like DNA-binding protein